jgi:transcriptional regulator with XRE-family HTH domain
MLSLTGSLQRIEQLIGLIKRGDYTSLRQVRLELGMAEEDVATQLNVSVQIIQLWEQGTDSPSNIQQAFWKLRLSDQLDIEIGRVLRTENKEVISQFCALIWQLQV